jgi:glycosyltransferase involved in cell wall biosynthesis
VSLRILVVHNRHRAGVPSGENRAVDYDVTLLREAGVEVKTYFRSNDEIDSFGRTGWMTLPARLFYSQPDVRRLRELLREWSPSVVHLHNPYPLLSPWVVRVARAESAAVVQTVHNYAHVCAAGTYFRFREGVLCRECVGRSIPWPAVRHACYRDSRPYSAVLGAALVAARPTWRHVDRFLAVSDAVATHLVQDAGLPADRVVVKPNGVPDPGPQPPPGRDFLFAGRLRREKGVELLLDAWELSGLGAERRLVIAGSGPEAGLVASRAAALSGVEVVGGLTPEEVGARMTAAGVVVIPSLWHEPLPLTAIEALAHARPLIVSNMGGLAGLVDDTVGWRVEPTAEALAGALRDAASADLALRGSAARRRYLEELSPARVTAQLLDVYRAVRKDVAHESL